MMPIVDGLLIIQEGRVAAYGPKDEIMRQDRGPENRQPRRRRSPELPK